MNTEEFQKHFNDCIEEKVADYNELADLLEQVVFAIRHDRPLPKEARGLVLRRSAGSPLTTEKDLRSAAIQAHHSAYNQQWEARFFTKDFKERDIQRKTLTNKEHERIENHFKWGIQLLIPVKSKTLLREVNKIREPESVK